MAAQQLDHSPTVGTLKTPRLSSSKASETMAYKGSQRKEKAHRIGGKQEEEEDKNKSLPFAFKDMIVKESRMLRFIELGWILHSQ